METPPDTDGMVHTFCIGQHESKRLTPVTPEVVQKAHESNVSPLVYAPCWIRADSMPV